MEIHTHTHTLVLAHQRLMVSFFVIGGSIRTLLLSCHPRGAFPQTGLTLSAPLTPPPTHTPPTLTAVPLTAYTLTSFVCFLLCLALFSSLLFFHPSPISVISSISLFTPGRSPAPLRLFTGFIFDIRRGWKLLLGMAFLINPLIVNCVGLQCKQKTKIFLWSSEKHF